MAHEPAEVAEPEGQGEADHEPRHVGAEGDRTHGHDRQGEEVGEDQGHGRRHALLLELLTDLVLGDIPLDRGGRRLAVLFLDRDLLAVDPGDLAGDGLVLAGDRGDRLARLDPDAGLGPPAEQIDPLEREQTDSENDEAENQRQPVLADPASSLSRCVVGDILCHTLSFSGLLWIAVKIPNGFHGLSP